MIVRDLYVGKVPISKPQVGKVILAKPHLQYSRSTLGAILLWVIISLRKNKKVWNWENFIVIDYGMNIFYPTFCIPLYTPSTVIYHD